MERVALALLQDRLSTNGSFILCDAMAEGFPIRHASRGFVDLFGYCPAECLGRKCGDLVSRPSFCDGDVAAAAHAVGMSLSDAEAAVLVQTRFAAQEVRSMAKGTSDGPAFCLALNRTKDGHIFVNEILMFIMHHPVVGWPYSIGLQRDVSSSVSVGEMLRAVDDEKLLALTASRRAVAEEHVQGLGMQADCAVEFFHNKALEMWEDIMRTSSVSSGQLKVQSLSEAPSTALSSGASTIEEFVNSTNGSDIGEEVVCLHVKARANMKVASFGGFSLSQLIASAACGSAWAAVQLTAVA